MKLKVFSVLVFAVCAGNAATGKQVLLQSKKGDPMVYDNGQTGRGMTLASLMAFGFSGPDARMFMAMPNIEKLQYLQNNPAKFQGFYSPPQHLAPAPAPLPSPAPYPQAAVPSQAAAPYPQAAAPYPQPPQHYGRSPAAPAPLPSPAQGYPAPAAAYLAAGPGYLVYPPAHHQADPVAYGKGTPVKERAGVLLVHTRGGELQIILGEGRINRTLMPFAGKSEDGDETDSQVASRELCEETGGLMEIKPEILEVFPAVTTPKKVLYILKGNFSVDAITNACRTASTNPRLRRAFKEVIAAHAVSLSALQAVSHELDGYHDVEVTTATGTKMLIDRWYTAPMGNFVRFSETYDDYLRR